MSMKPYEYLAISELRVPQGHHLNPLLLDYLREMNDLADKMGGEIISRQVVGLAIATFRRIFQDQPCYLPDSKPAE